MTGGAVAAGLAAAAGLLALVDCLPALRRARRWRAGRPRARRGAPDGLTRRIGGLGRRLRAPQAPRDLDARLAAAGAPAGLGADDVMALKCALGAVCALAAVVIGDVGARAVVALGGIFACVGFLAPDAALLMRAASRARAVRAEAPDVLDRLRLAAEAGLSPSRASARAAGVGGGPLCVELRALAAARALGVPGPQALARLRSRCPQPEVEALAAAISRCERHGAPLAPALAVLAESARAERVSRLLERAQRAAPKIQLVVALLLVPAALLMVAAGLLANLR
ncbi:MAG: type II secretion system F family protein [Solirubrobacteraceae bacterium]|nr:type II secretion system F family protein [Solirubrobacteraceae bacterium]